MFFVASQGGQHPQLEPTVSTHFCTLENGLLNPYFSLGFFMPPLSSTFSRQYFCMSSPILKSLCIYLDHHFAIFVKKITKNSIFVLKNDQIHPNMTMFYPMPRLDLIFSNDVPSIPYSSQKEKNNKIIKYYFYIIILI